MGVSTGICIQHRGMQPVGDRVGERSTLVFACSPTASVFLVIVAYRMAAAVWRMLACPLPVTGMPIAAARVQARFSGCCPTIRLLFPIFFATLNKLCPPPLPCRCTCLPGYTGNGQVCYGSIMQQLSELNTEVGGRWSGQLSSAISLFSTSIAQTFSLLLLSLVGNGL